MRGRLGAWVSGAVAALVIAAPAAATTFPVTRTDDPPGGTCAPGNCSLRQAVAAANGHSGPDTVFLPPGTYTLGRPELGSNGQLTLLGSGAASTVITGGHQSGPMTVGRAGVLDSGANLAVVRLSMVGNSATTDDPTSETITVGAGAILQTGGTIALIDSVISGNQLLAKATSGAGGVMVNTAVITMVNSRITGNSATLGGTTVAGGLQVNSSSAGSLSNVDSSTFDGNSIGTASVSIGAGALLFNAAGGQVANSTIHSNTASPVAAAAGAGGLFADNSNLTVTNSTLSANSGSGAALVGNLQAAGSETHTLHNTIISDGVGFSGFSNCLGTFTSGGGNVESANQCGLSAAAGDQPNTNPLLGPLQDNGGPTPTQAIAPGSPALDAAIGAFCPARDQRGVPRPQGAACDSGAFEFGAPENLAAPSITGTARVFSTLTCSPGLWRGGPTFAFAWLRNGVVIPGAGGATYRLTTADQDGAIQCRVTAADAVGSTSAVSAAVGVAAFPLPVNQRRPSISGTLRAGSKVRCNAGQWSGSPSFSFSWLRDGSGIRRANGSRYKISGHDVGHALQCQVTARNAGGSVVAFSAPRIPARAKPKPKHRR